MERDPARQAAREALARSLVTEAVSLASLVLMVAVMTQRDQLRALAARARGRIRPRPAGDERQIAEFRRDVHDYGRGHHE